MGRGPQPQTQPWAASTDSLSQLHSVTVRACFLPAGETPESSSHPLHILMAFCLPHWASFPPTCLFLICLLKDFAKSLLEGTQQIRITAPNFPQRSGREGGSQISTSCPFQCQHVSLKKQKERGRALVTGLINFILSGSIDWLIDGTEVWIQGLGLAR
jgi:hypothetical protein